MQKLLAYINAIYFLGQVAIAHAQPTATVTKLGGHVRHNQKAIKTGQTIPAIGSMVAKGKNSFVDMELNGGEIIRLRNGMFRFPNAKKKEKVLTLASGQIYAFFRKKTKEKHLKIRTKVAVMAVRGTKFMVEAKPNKTYLCVCEGNVAAKKVNDSVQSTRYVKAGQDLYLRSNDSIRQPASATFQMMDMVTSEFSDMGYPITKTLN